MPINTAKLSSLNLMRKGPSFLNTAPSIVDVSVARYALVDGLEYLKNRLGWSGSKIAKILHLPPNTVNTWLKNGYVPMNSSTSLHPDVQVIIHLLAIHRSLEAMFEDHANQHAWLSTVHPELNVIPEEVMGESIEGLIFIRQYLDYVRGRGA